MMAAGQAALGGAEVVLFEKMEKPGRKLRITGKGRCNLTNIAPVREFVERFGKNGKFLHQAFSRFFAEDLVAFLGELGIAVESERGGRVFPENNDAPAVTEALIRWVRSCGVRVHTNAPVARILTQDNRAIGVIVNKEKITADAVVIACGGASYPGTGSTGDGYKLAREVGHTIVPVRPALVPLMTRGPVAKQLQGLSLKNVKVVVLVDGKKNDEAFGEMLFTHYGLSGPIILTLSRGVVDALEAGRKVSASIDLKPALDDKKLDARLLRDIKEHPNQKYHTMLKELLPQKMLDVCCVLTGISPGKSAHQVTAAERKRLRLWLKDFRFEITGHRSFTEAIVTAGGVALKEIDPRTMESKLIRGLYFAGEVLDIDGDTGGYNLQAAFSTGWLAGNSVVLSGNKRNEWI